MEMSSITATVEQAIRSELEQLAAERGVSGEEYAAEAIRRAVESDQDFRSFIQEGVDSAERGELIPHEQVMAELDQMIIEHRARWAGQQ